MLLVTSPRGMPGGHPSPIIHHPCWGGSPSPSLPCCYQSCRLPGTHGDARASLFTLKTEGRTGTGSSQRGWGGVKVTFNSDLKSPGFVWRIPRQGYPAEGWVQPRRCDPKWVFAAAKPLPGSGVGPEEGGMVVVAGDSGTRALQRDRGCPGKVKSAFSWEAP